MKFPVSWTSTWMVAVAATTAAAAPPLIFTTSSSSSVSAPAHTLAAHSATTVAAHGVHTTTPAEPHGHGTTAAPPHETSAVEPDIHIPYGPSNALWSFQPADRSAWRVAAAPGVFNLTAQFAVNQLDKVIATFKPPQPFIGFEFWGYKSADGGLYALVIDGKAAAHIDARNATAGAHDAPVLLFNTTALPRQHHVVQLRNLVDPRTHRAGAFNIDHVVITCAADPPRTDTGPAATHPGTKNPQPTQPGSKNPQPTGSKSPQPSQPANPHAPPKDPNPNPNPHQPAPSGSASGKPGPTASNPAPGSSAPAPAPSQPPTVVAAPLPSSTSSPDSSSSDPSDPSDPSSPSDPQSGGTAPPNSAGARSVSLALLVVGASLAVLV